MPNHAVLRQHLLRHSTYTIHSKLRMIVHNAITSSSEHLWFNPSIAISAFAVFMSKTWTESFPLKA